MIGGLVGAGLGAAGLVERKGSDKAVQDIGPFGGGMMGVGGLAGMATQGGFMGNAGGMFPGIGGLAGMALNQFGPQAQGLPNDEQGPSQGPNTPVKNYPGMGYGPVGPMGGGLPPTPLASMFGGPQMGQAGGLLGNANFFSDPMTIKRVS